MKRLELPLGYYELPPGQLVNVVTCLEMRQKPESQGAMLPAGCHLEIVDAADPAKYRAVFRSIGEDLMWFSRLIMADEKLFAILSDPHVESYYLMQGAVPVGLLELDFRHMPNCELAFFGLVKGSIGRGLGSALMATALAKAWSRPINRFWVHTCHFDHPHALGFYRRAGFVPSALMIEVHDDPRLKGFLPRHASPHVALLDQH